MVVTSALHAEGPGIEPQRNQIFATKFFLGREIRVCGHPPFYLLIARAWDRLPPKALTPPSPHQHLSILIPSSGATTWAYISTNTMLDDVCDDEISAEFRSCPIYPNAIAWAKKANHIAVTAERVVYILVWLAPLRLCDAPEITIWMHFFQL